MMRQYRNKTLKMRCCVAFCRNTGAPGATCNDNRISFHAFPSEENLRAAWLKALDKEDTYLPNSPVVCSQHFLSDDIYETESGVRQIATGAIPSIVQACIICLGTDSKLFLMSKYKLEEAYEMLTGYPLCGQGKLKETLCVQCCKELLNFIKFRNKSLRARSLIMDLVNNYKSITIRHLKMINRTKNRLKSDIVPVVLRPDHFDLQIVEKSGENKEMKLDENVTSFENNSVKIEGSMSLDEKLESMNKVDKNFDINVKCLSNKETVSDDPEKHLEQAPTTGISVASSDQKAMIERFKYETDNFECTLCFEEFDDIDIYNRHISTHLENNESDGQYQTSKASELGTAGSLTDPTPTLIDSWQRIDADCHPCPKFATSLPDPLASGLATTNGKGLFSGTEKLFDHWTPCGKEDSARKDIELLKYRGPVSKPIVATKLQSKTDLTDKQSSLERTEHFTDKKSYGHGRRRALQQKRLLDKHVKSNNILKYFTCQLCNPSKGNSVSHTKTLNESYSCMLCNCKSAKKT